MRMKKGIISISTIAVLILVVFLAVRFTGGQEHVANVKSGDGTIVQNDNTNSIASNDKTTNKTTSEAETNKMDVAYINDKTNVGIYTVKKNDTVFSIAKTYMPSQDKNKIVEFIKTRNSMGESYKIVEGQKIVIPYEIKSEVSKAVVTEGNTIEYTVKKQDTLTSIAKNNMPSYSVKKAIVMLKETNKIINENEIKDGTHIYIPR
ncbi:lytic transglycosylase [Clostridium sp.]|uniref:lytic transglycosylase n=1 Tax=Clostridium sp. TaxID=1506 RepID=UPI002617884A|nr:LysM peptidoglycan-binding domain-containing protein [uncultured Clostridium sp.]